MAAPRVAFGEGARGDCRNHADAAMKHVTPTPWTDEERAMLRRLRSNGLSIRQCAEMMGRSFHSVQRAGRRLDLPRSAPGPRPKQPRQEPPRRVGLVSLPVLPSLMQDE